MKFIPDLKHLPLAACAERRSFRHLFYIVRQRSDPHRCSVKALLSHHDQHLFSGCKKLAKKSSLISQTTKEQEVVAVRGQGWLVANILALEALR